MEDTASLRDDHELEQMRRSLAMLRPGSLVWTREQAVDAIREIQRLRFGMAELLDERRRTAAQRPSAGRRPPLR